VWKEVGKIGGKEEGRDWTVGQRGEGGDSFTLAFRSVFSGTLPVLRM